ncbi:MAG: hypothetical protein GXO04_03560 [Aquificae bacterium]|nr:hypothetical protein [Aquificota bacterium]
MGNLLRISYIVLFILMTACGGAKKIQTDPLTFFLENYKKGVYRYKVLEVKKEKEGCTVLLRELVKGEKYELKANEPLCSLLRKGRLIEVAGERFVPPPSFRLVGNVPLSEHLYIWVIERERQPHGIIILPWGGVWGDGRYRIPRGGWGGK